MRRKKSINQGIEITTFKLRGHSIEEFIAANADIDAWLKLQPGFQSRRIAEKEDGSILDMLICDSVEDGNKAMLGIITEIADSKVHEMIDQRTVSWNVYPVRHEIAQL
jgi:hypothetical protein